MSPRWMLHTTIVSGASAIALLALGCGGAPPIEACKPIGAIEPVCGFQNPEDLALLPDGRTLLVSQFGTMDGAKPGSLAVFDSVRRELRPAYTGGGGAVSEGWGDPRCPGAPSEAFAPHGLELSMRPDERWQLLVVSHGGREAIEFFEVMPDGLDTKVEWRGCAVPPDDSYLNDVVASADGGFLTTHMMPKSTEMTSTLRGLLFGTDTGFVYRWTPSAGWAQVPGTDAPFPNGLALSPDGRSIYVNVYLGDEVRHIDVTTGELLGRVAVSHPDNITWSSGRDVLLVASHTGSTRDSLACMDVEQGTCPMPFEIVAIDPETLARKTILAHDGPPMGAATVAVQVGTDLWLGTFAGDRVARVVGAATSLAP